MPSSAAEVSHWPERCFAWLGRGLGLCVACQNRGTACIWLTPVPKLLWSAGILVQPQTILDSGNWFRPGQ